MARVHLNSGVKGQSANLWDNQGQGQRGVHSLQAVYDGFSSSPHNREGFNKGLGTLAGNMYIGDQIVFGSCLMQGACGPTPTMINTWINTMPTTLQSYLSSPGVAQGIQRWTVPDSGTYRYTIAGAFATHDAYLYDTNLPSGGLYNTNLTRVDRTGGNLQSYILTSTVTGSTARGTPGVLVVEATHTAGDIVDIMVGQRGGSAINGSTFDVAGSAGGASAIFINGWNNWNKTVAGWSGAIAGGGAANRNRSSQGTGDLTSYSTTGGAGDNNGGAGGTNGSGGGDNSTANYDSTSGAGLVGNGSQHTDQRAVSPNVPVNINGRTAKAFNNATTPGQGNISGSSYVNPWGSNSSAESLFIGIDASGNVTSVGTGDAGYSTTYQTQFSNYAVGGTTVLVNCQIPLNCTQGGFGGGGVGNWGGCAGSGGFSGGGAGINGNSCGGGGSSWQQNMTYVSHTIASKTSTYNDWLSSNDLIWQGINYGRTPKGSIIGNGEIAILRIS